MPWLNQVDSEWLESLSAAFDTLFVLDDHAPVGGLGDSLLNALSDSGSLRHTRLFKFAVDGHPACGTPAEVLDHHGLSGVRLAERIECTLNGEVDCLPESAKRVFSHA